MKKIDKKSSAAGSQKKTPFFQKEGRQGFFRAGGQDPSFFSNASGNTSRIQTKLSVGQPNDPYEREADHVADKLVQKKPIFESKGEGDSPIVGLRKQPAIQRDDARFEAGDLGSALTARKMTKDPIMGKTFYAENCRSIFGCRIGFTFDKAYKGVFPYAPAGRNVKGVYVKISSKYDHSICGKCDQLRLIQTVRSIKKNTSGDMVTSDPNDSTRKKRSGWDTPNAASKGWRVDTLTSATVPFYDVPAGFDSQIGSPAKPAILWDSPGDWETDTNSGKEFQTYFVCETSGGGKKTLAGINWGYYIDSSGVISFSPVTPLAFCGPSQELKDSAKRWDAITGNTAVNIDFAAEDPVDHLGERTMLWFNFDSDKLRNDATIKSDVLYGIALHRIRQHIMANSFLSKIVIHGFASADGDSRHNLELSQLRCKAIQMRLIADGIPSSIIQIQPHGATTDLTPQALNRRVEIETTNVMGKIPSILNSLISPFKSIFE